MSSPQSLAATILCSLGNAASPTGYTNGTDTAAATASANYDNISPRDLVAHKRQAHEQCAFCGATMGARLSSICAACRANGMEAPQPTRREELLLLPSIEPAPSCNLVHLAAASEAPPRRSCERCGSSMTHLRRTVCGPCGHAERERFRCLKYKINPSHADRPTLSPVMVKDSTTRVCALCGSLATPKWRGWGGDICNVCGLDNYKRTERASSPQITPTASCLPSQPYRWGADRRAAYNNELPFQSIGEGVKRRADKNDTRATPDQMTLVAGIRKRRRPSSRN